MPDTLKSGLKFAVPPPNTSGTQTASVGGTVGLGVFVTQNSAVGVGCSVAAIGVFVAATGSFVAVGTTPALSVAVAIGAGVPIGIGVTVTGRSIMIVFVPLHPTRTAIINNNAAK
jgi:hypothetical protein